MMFGGDPGIGRLFTDSIGGEITWVLPAALIALVAGFWCTRRAPRTDPSRSALLLWGGIMLISGLVFSFMKGIMHPYYTVAMAPAMAATLAIGAVELWSRREKRPARLALAAMLIATGVWSFFLLGRADGWLPWLRWVLLVASILVGLALLSTSTSTTSKRAMSARSATAVAIAAVVVGLVGPAAFTVATIGNSHQGGMRASGPERHDDNANEGEGGGWHREPQKPPSAQMVALLRATDGRWAAATVGSHTSAPLQLGSGMPIMAVGGFSGRDESPTFAAFQGYVRDGQIGYFIEEPDHHDDQGKGSRNEGNGGPGGWGRRQSESVKQIKAWVEKTHTPTVIDGAKVYDLRHG